MKKKVAGKKAVYNRRQNSIIEKHRVKCWNRGGSKPTCAQDVVLKYPARPGRANWKNRLVRAGKPKVVSYKKQLRTRIGKVSKKPFKIKPVGAFGGNKYRVRLKRKKKKKKN